VAGIASGCSLSSTTNPDVGITLHRKQPEQYAVVIKQIGFFINNGYASSLNKHNYAAL
jgi:hypothetical protein